MFCPKCANQSNDDQRFCKVCGTNLMSVNQALHDPRSLVTEQEWKRMRKKGKDLSDAAFDAAWRRAGSAIEGPKDSIAYRLSQKMMQGGIITSCIGIGVTIFFYFLFGALASTEHDPQSAAVLRVLWSVGVVPLFVGIGLFLGGYFIFRPKKHQDEIETRTAPSISTAQQQALPEQRSDVFAPSVTEHTTRHL
ncbi:MAG TPA: hypothetical protein VFC63_03260, partial [Blastocatellia bacterium]|nr:hypothetical protein [Blastocatellia bacterium]